MKKIYLAFMFIVMAIACQEESSIDSTASTEQDPRFIQFKDWDDFITTANSLVGKDISYLKAWQNQKGFVSLKSVFEDAVLEEEKFAEEMIAKYGENSTLTRKDVGYSEYTTRYIKSGAFKIGEYEELQMDVSIPLLGAIVNADGIAKIGESLVQFKHDAIKKIKNGDPSQIKFLSSVQESNNNIIIEKLDRSSRVVSDAARTQALTSCSHVSGSYKLIAYEEHLLKNDSPCGGSLYYYWMRLRSLKKFLGTWQNHNTGYLQVVSNNVKITSYQSTYPNGFGEATVIRGWIDETGITHDLPYGNDESHYYLNNFAWKCEPRTYPNDCLYIVVDDSDITAIGKNGTTCNLGNPGGYIVRLSECHLGF